MGLNSALVDRARVVRKMAGPRNTEGRSEMQPVPFEWFRARLMPEPAPEGEDPGRGRRRTAPNPQMMCGAFDLAGDPVAIRASDEIEVASLELGDALWRVNGDPVPIRKKRRVIGWTVPLSRLNEPRREDL